MISRRNLLTGSAALAAYAALPASPALAANGTIPGAIRWDAWYGNVGSGGAGSSEDAVNPGVSVTLGPTQFQGRAPFFSRPVSSYLNSIVGTQASMDAEIAYAASAGLKYWAYCWYGQQTPDSPMQNAWHFHQSSSVKNNMNWCLLLQFSRIGNSTTWGNNIATYVSYMQQTNYQTVTIAATARPLIYLFVDDTTRLAANWGGSLTNLQTAFNALRSACTGAGLGTPYIVIMNGNVATAASYATGTSSDAISNYTGGGTISGIGGGSWSAYETALEAYWASEAGAFATIIPPCQIGLDSRPRKQHPQPLTSPGIPHNGENLFVAVGSAAQITAQLQAAVSYVVANPTIVPSKTILIYSWDECDEFGAIVPTYNAANPAVPITTTLGAVGAVTW